MKSITSRLRMMNVACSLNYRLTLHVKVKSSSFQESWDIPFQQRHQLRIHEFVVIGDTQYSHRFPFEEVAVIPGELNFVFRLHNQNVISPSEHVA